ncbi:MAG TPA: glycosyl transferase, partial [Burkholderiales bacterium]|nr:glycosyl transferase [Burkholderiales bacterium]
LWPMADGLGIPALALVILATVWMTNLYNFMDGSDGLAGGMALIGFAAFGAGAWLAGDSGFAVLNFSVAASALAFLLFNFHPARIFMGDAGSIPLGFLAAVLGVQGWQRGLWPAWFPALVFSPFIVDASVTLLRRLARRERVWRAHREHYYQRLVQMGWGHRGTALAEYAVMLAAAAGALWGARQAPGWQAALTAVWIVAYLLIAAGIDRGWKRFAAQGGGSR